MQVAMLWVSIIGIIVIPVAGALLRDLLLKKMDTIISQQKEDRELFLRKYDEQKDIFVRKDIYEQACKFQKAEMDEKYNHIIEKIEGLKDLILKNFNDKN